MGDVLPAAAKNVVGYAETISKTLMVGGAVCVGAIAARALGSNEIKVGPLNLPVGYTTLVVGLGTLTHVFWSSHILTALREFFRDEVLRVQEKYHSEHPDILALDYGKPDYNSDSAQELFDEIRTQKGLFLRGLVPRTLREGSRIARMSWSDPTTWLSYGLALLTIVAILPWRYDNGVVRWESPKMLIAYAAIALILVITNWFAGALWIISLSSLTEDASINIHSIGDSQTFLRIVTTSAIIIALIIGAVMLMPSNLVALLGVVAIVGVIAVASISLLVGGVGSR